MANVLAAHAIGRVDLIKIDTEGAEAWILPTMADDLQAHRTRRILLELHPPQLPELGFAVDQVVARLVAAGYRAWRIDHSLAAHRRASYGHVSRVRESVKPVSQDFAADTWPHVLFLAPGVDFWQSLARHVTTRSVSPVGVAWRLTLRLAAA